MERAACNIIYLDRRAREDTLRRPSNASTSGQGVHTGANEAQDYFKMGYGQSQVEVQASLDSILSTFSAGRIEFRELADDHV
jgi:hypothetical protein